MKHIIVFVLLLGLALLLSKYFFSVTGTIIETITSIFKSIFFPKKPKDNWHDARGGEIDFYHGKNVCGNCKYNMTRHSANSRCEKAQQWEERYYSYEEPKDNEHTCNDWEHF